MEPRQPKIWEAVIPIVFMMVIMIVATVIWKIQPHIPLVFSCGIAALIANRCGNDWKHILLAMVDSITRAVEALLIILCVGMLIGTWVWAGTMPAMVYYGLDLVSPVAFLPLGCILTGIVGLATGSSWTASGTVGVALMGIAMGLGINPALAAGMVISGAYMGDKLSPLSDSTNVAAMGAETPLYDHVTAMMVTTIPSFIISLVLYGIVGAVVVNRDGYDATLAHDIQDVIADNFYLSPWIMLPVLVVIVAAVKRIPAIPSLMLATVFGGVIAMAAQGASMAEVLNAMHYGYVADTGNRVADELLNRGGIDSMMWTISLIMFALAYGGILEKCGFVEVLLGGVVRRTKSIAGLVAAEMLIGIACDIVLTDQYLAILVPGRMFQKAFDEKGLSRSFLSRTTEDAATLWSPMIPWNGCGAYQSATLGVANFAFAPFAFMNLINPVYAFIITFLGIGIRYKEYDGLRGEALAEAKARRKAALAEERAQRKANRFGK